MVAALHELGVASGREVALSPPHTGTIWEVCLSADGRRALTRSRGSEKGLLGPTCDEWVLWDAETGRELASWSAGADRFSCLALGPDGTLLAEGRIRVVAQGRPGGRYNPFERCGEIRVYDLRHTATSLMIDAGADLKAASEALGHSDLGITMKVYRHVRTDQRDHAVGALAHVLDTLEGGQVAPRDTP